MATTIRFSKLSISPQLDMAPGFGTGTNNPGYPTEYEMGYTGDGYDHAFICYQGSDTADISTTSAITNWTLTDPLGYTFTAPTGMEFIRIIVERIADSAAPDTAYPVAIVSTGPGLPEISEEVCGTYEMVIYQPRTLLTANLTSSSHLSVAVPSQNQASLQITVQLGIYKPTA